jgi:glutathione S-transferase
MLKVWGRRNSVNVQKVLWLVDELGIEHEHIPAGGPFGRVNEPEFRAMNPHGLVPVIEDGSLRLWESHAILRYLAARYGQASFWHEDPAERALVDRWMDWSQTTLQPEFINGVFWAYFRTPEAKRDLKAIDRSVRHCAELFRLLDSLLGTQPYLAEQRLSLTDIPIGSLLYRYFELDIERPPIPKVRTWYQSLQQRSAYREHVMVSFEDLRGR